MSTTLGKYEISPEVQQRANELYEQHRHQIYIRTDQLFAALMILQWAACLLSAWWISPRSWAGPESTVHIHLWAAADLGRYHHLFAGHDDHRAARQRDHTAHCCRRPNADLSPHYPSNGRPDRSGTFTFLDR